MDNKRKIKIDLWFLILTILFIIALVFTIIHICNSAKANTDDYYDKQPQNTIASSTTNSSSSNVKSNNSINNKIDLNSLDDFSIINNTVSSTTDSNNSEQASPNVEKKYKLNNHIYKFDETKKVMLNTGSANQNLELQTDTYVLKMNTDTMYYDSLKSKEDLSGFFQKNYQITADSNIKSGTLQDLNVILCSFKEDNKTGYFIVTKLNESEIIYFKVYNKVDMSSLIDDLSQPLDEISSIINNSIE
ncbi:MAG: hypothetical protein IKE01_05220 [Clostridia bacterium]|nr:hypothetical protein [Clostridia bacterium]